MTATNFIPNSVSDRALFVLRLVAGTIFAVHGWQKLFTYGIAGITAGFTKAGVPIPGFTAPAVGLVELVGGVALIVGLLGRVIPALFAIDMLGAMVFVHFKNGFFMPTGYEFVLALLGISVALTLTGPGRLSLDAALVRRSSSRSGQAG